MSPAPRMAEPQGTGADAAPDFGAVQPPPPSSTPGRHRRYSRFVSLMKVALPLIAVLLVCAVALWPQLRDLGEDGFSISFADLGREVGLTQRLVNARYYGTDSDDQPYTITADMAEETEPGSALLRLDNPKADITLNDGAWLMLGADAGLYRQADGVLDLSGAVNLFHDQGYEIHTTAATIDVQAGVAHGDQPIQGQGPFGELEAEGFRLTDTGKRIEFTGKARLLLRPSAEPPPQQTRSPKAGAAPDAPRDDG